MRRPPLKKQIALLVAHWRTILGLEAWAIEVRFDEKVHTGTCIAQPQYEEAIITFNLPRIRKQCRRPEALEDLVCHELVHCVIWKSSERAVTQVTRALLRAAGRPLI